MIRENNSWSMLIMFIYVESIHTTRVFEAGGKVANYPLLLSLAPVYAR
jgi:hypothetical protein